MAREYSVARKEIPCLDRGALWVDWGRRRSGVDMVYDQFLMKPGNDSRLEAQFATLPVRPFFGLEEGGASP